MGEEYFYLWFGHILCTFAWLVCVSVRSVKCEVPLYDDTGSFLGLTHLPLKPHICISESGQHWLRKWLVAFSAPSHYLNQCLVIVHWNLRNKLQWNFNQNTKLFIRENAFENIICEKAAILSRGRWVNSDLQDSMQDAIRPGAIIGHSSTRCKVQWNLSITTT